MGKGRAATWFRNPIERLERRVLLAHIGLDLSFGDAGRAPVDADKLLANVNGDQILVVGDERALRLNADGAVDTTFTDAGATTGSGRIVQGARLSGERLYILEGPQDSASTLVIRAINAQSGAVDAAFSDGGSVTITTVGIVLYSTAFVAMPDGGVLLSVSNETQDSASPSGFTYADRLYRLDPAGEFDPDFGGSTGHDRLYADYAASSDTLFGGAGDDVLVSRDAAADQLFGGRGTDTALVDDEEDERAGIEVG
jgi:hypothetical protein